MADDLPVTLLNGAQARAQDFPHSRRISGEVLSYDLPHARHRRGAADRVARMRAGHRTRPKLVHYLRPADHGRKRQRTADALAAANHVRCNAVVLKPPELARPAKSSLH